MLSLSFVASVFLLHSLLFITNVKSGSANDCSVPKLFLGQQYTSAAPPFEDYFCYEGPDEIVDVHVLLVEALNCDNLVQSGNQTQLCENSKVQIRFKSSFEYGQNVTIKNTPNATGLTLVSSKRYYLLVRCSSAADSSEAPLCSVPTCATTEPNILFAEDDISDEARDLLNAFGNGRMCKEGLNIAFRVSLAVLLAVLMFGMGATVTFNDLRDIIRDNWKPFAIGLASQVLLMPFLTLLLALVFAYDDATAIGAILIGCTPGGVTSQLFTYWSRGSVLLSIAMTMASTLISFGSLPAMAYIFTLPFAHNAIDEQGGVDIPWLELFIVLLLIVFPVFLGALVRRYVGPHFSTWLVRSGVAAGVVGIMVAIILGMLINIDIFDTPATTWVGAALLPFLGFAVGYSLAWVTRQEVDQRRTISFEVGVQNASLTITLVAWSFVGSLQREVMRFPLLYSVFVLIDGFIVAMTLRILNHYHVRYFYIPSKKEATDVGGQSVSLGDRNSLVDSSRSSPAPDDEDVELYQKILSKYPRKHLVRRGAPGDGDSPVTVTEVKDVVEAIDANELFVELQDNQYEQIKKDEL